MKNENFLIEYNDDGTVAAIQNPHDKDSMTFVLPEKSWGHIYSKNYKQVFDPTYMRTVGFTQTDERATSRFTNDKIEVTSERFFDADGNFTERYTVKNLRDVPIFLLHGDLGIAVPFNDKYTHADDCMVHRCNTHIWCAGNCTYVNAVKMGVSDINLALVLTRGSVPSYSVNAKPDTDNYKSWEEWGSTNTHRGEFIFDCDNITLDVGEEYVIEWKLFWFKDYDDFVKKASKYDTFVSINAEHHTVFSPERIKFEVTTAANDINITLNGESIAYTRTGNKVTVEHAPAYTGEHKFVIEYDKKRTYTEFLAADDLETIISRRVKFIVEKQQFIKDGNPLDGAYLIYDNDEEHMYFDDVIGDHNACRERAGMALLIAKYLQSHDDKKVRASLDKYLEFLKREFYIEETGWVTGQIGKKSAVLRLYNLPWIATLFTEIYLLTDDSWYPEQIHKMYKNYYSQGGLKFYPNGISIYRTYTAMKKYDEQKAEDLLEYFTKHVENMINTGTSYPPHEVNYEQTIVSPAATFISEMGKIRGDKRYMEKAKMHVEVLKRFAGSQPSFHMKEIPIRFWDDFWFGKSKMFADNYPHYWSCLSARSFIDYYEISGDGEYLERAQECMRNCMCLFDKEGRGSAAYVYPFKVDGRAGAFYDKWANDQDFALYFALTMLHPCSDIG